jgi:hypothetical protein
VSDVKVALVGAPRSGNRLIQRLLQRHGFVAEVRHYGMRKAFRTGGEGAEFAIWPVRDLECWRKSCSRDLIILPKPLGVLGELTVNDLRHIHNERTLEYLADHAVACLPVSYEALVAEPDMMGRCILSFVKSTHERFQDWKGWGEEIIDGNAKWTATSPT